MRATSDPHDGVSAGVRISDLGGAVEEGATVPDRTKTLDKRLRLRGVVLGLILALALAACGGDGSTDDDNASASNDDDTSDDTSQDDDESDSGTSFALPEEGVHEDRLVVGVAADQTGPVTAYSIPLTTGAETRLEAANEEGGVHGRQIEIAVEDTRYTGEGSLRAVRALTDRTPAIAVITSFGEPGVTATNSEIQEVGLPAVGEPTMYDAMFDNEWWFTINPHYADGAEVMLEYVRQETGNDNPEIGVVGLDASVGHAFVDILEHLDANVVVSEFIGVQDTDASSQAQAIQAADPDYVLTMCSPGSAIALMNSMSAAGVDIPVLGHIGCASPSVWEALPPEVGERYAALHSWVPDSFEEGEAAEMVRISEEFGVEQDVYSQASYILGWVSADVLLQALEDVGPEPTRDALRDTLEGLRYDPGNLGPTIEYSPEIHLARGIRPYSYDYDEQRMVPLGSFDDYADAITGSYYADQLSS